MTVNWERENGDRVEDFVAAYLLLRAGTGNQIRPSQGDNGIDVQIPTSAGWEIYQVKRFASNLGSSEKRQITGSWERFKDQVLAKGGVTSWYLVLPLEPTLQNLQWFNKLTEGSDIKTEWIGRAQLDAWAAELPRLREYFFGNGEQRWHDLMAEALRGGSSPERGSGSPLLASVQERLTYLHSALDEVDPFYRYELEVRSGSLADTTPTDSLLSETLLIR